MKHNDKVRLRTGVEVSRLSLGTAALGGLYTSVSDADCTDTVLTAIDNGINFIDTAPHYGKGTSEVRIGKALAGRDRSTFVISTKIGRLLVPSTTDIDEFFMDADNTVERKYDFSASGVRQSLEGSLERLGMDSVEILFIHDPDANADEAILEAYPEVSRYCDRQRYFVRHPHAKAARTAITTLRHKRFNFSSFHTCITRSLEPLGRPTLRRSLGWACTSGSASKVGEGSMQRVSSQRGHPSATLDWERLIRTVARNLPENRPQPPSSAQARAPTPESAHL